MHSTPCPPHSARVLPSAQRPAPGRAELRCRRPDGAESAPGPPGRPRPHGAPPAAGSPRRARPRRSLTCRPSAAIARRRPLSLRRRKHSLPARRFRLPGPPLPPSTPAGAAALSAVRSRSSRDVARGDAPDAGSPLCRLARRVISASRSFTSPRRVEPTGNPTPGSNRPFPWFRGSFTGDRRGPGASACRGGQGAVPDEDSTEHTRAREGVLFRGVDPGTPQVFPSRPTAGAATRPP